MKPAIWPRRSPPSRRRRPTCSSCSTPRLGLSRLSPARSSRTRSPRRHRRSTRSSARRPGSAPSWHNADPVRRPAPRDQVADQNSPAIASALETGANVLPGCATAQPQLAPHGQDSRGSSRPTPASRRASPAPPRPRLPDADAAVHRAGPVDLQLRESCSAQRASSSSASATESATGQRFLVMSSQVGPTRDGPGVASRQQGRKQTNPAGFATANFLHSTPTRTPRRPASTRVSARPATSSLHRQEGRDRQHARAIRASSPRTRRSGSSRKMSLLRRKQRGPVRCEPSERLPIQRIFGRHYRGPSPAEIGLVLVILLAIGSYLAFTKHIPFTGRATSSMPRSRTRPP